MSLLFWKDGAGEFTEYVPSTGITGTGALLSTVAVIAGVGVIADEPSYALLRPDADSSIGNWTDNAGGVTDIYQAIDEVTASDVDYIRSAQRPASDIYKVSFSDLNPPRHTGFDVTVNYRIYKDGEETVDLTTRLVEGTTTRATWSHTDLSITPLDVTQTLSGAQASSITDWNDLFLEFEAISP